MDISSEKSKKNTWNWIFSPLKYCSLYLSWTLRASVDLSGQLEISGWKRKKRSRLPVLKPNPSGHPSLIKSHTQNGQSSEKKIWFAFFTEKLPYMEQANFFCHKPTCFFSKKGLWHQLSKGSWTLDASKNSFGYNKLEMNEDFWIFLK